jgi:hypothetical protein
MVAPAPVGFHLDRPQFGRCSIRFTDGFLRGFTAPSARIFAPMIRPP